MSIKQNGGVFGRNPTFNDVTIEGQLTFDGDIDINSDLKIDGNLEVTGTSSLTGNVGIGTSAATRPLTVSGGQILGEFINPTASQTARIYATCGTQTGQIMQYGNTHATDPNTLRLNTTAGDIAFAPSSVERVRVTAAGNVEVSTGNVVIGTSGKGIDFSATAGTGTSELLDDYEEGTWTPVVSDGTNVATTSAAEGTYTKVGRQVTLSGRFTLSSTGSTSGGIRITGLPFAVASGNAARGSLNVSYAASFGLTAGYSITGSCASGASHIYLGVWDVGGFTTDLLASELTATSTLYFSAVYFTS